MADETQTGRRPFFRLRGRSLEVFGRGVTLPASRLARIAIGVFFILGGCLAILPVFGIWMLPLGILILSLDIAIVRRWRRRTEVRWSRWRAGRRSRAAALGAVPDTAAPAVDLDARYDSGPRGETRPADRP